jgi:hypothetical protein
MTEQRAAVLVTELHRAGLLDKVDGGFAPHNWEGRQYKSDNSTERVKRFRERKSAVDPAVSETRPEQSRTETEQNRADAPRAVQVDLVEEALRADLRETLGGHDLSRVADWLGKGYDPGMVHEVVRDLRRRKPDIASLAYFDAALADRRAKRPETPAARATAAAAVDWDVCSRGLLVAVRWPSARHDRLPCATRTTCKARHQREQRRKNPQGRMIKATRR